MKFLELADIHFSGYSQDPISESGLNERLHYLNVVVRNALDYGISQGLKKTVFAGDIYHTKSIIHSVAQNVFLNILRDYKDKMYFYIIDGNHDMSSKSGDGVSALTCCDNEPNVMMMHDPREIENIWFVPWNEKSMIKSIKNGSPNKAPYLISHFGLNEGQLNSGISIISDVSLKDLNIYKQVLLGHYHKGQEVGNVIYVGSPIQMDWGEKHEEKRFLIVDTENHTIESIPTIGYKKYYEFKVTKDNAKEVFEQATILKSDGHGIKIRKIENFDDEVLSDSFMVIDDTEKDITNRGITSSMSTSDKLLKYLEIKEIPKTKIEKYMKVGLDIIDTCYR